MNTSTLNFKLSAFLLAAVVIALLIAGGMFAVLRHAEADAATASRRAMAAKNATYQLLETLIDAQGALQDSLRLKDPDEIEKGIEHFKQRTGVAQQLIKDGAGVAPVVGQKFSALLDTDQQALDKFLVGDNSGAFEILINSVPVQFAAVLQAIRQYNAQVEVTLSAESAADTAGVRKLLWYAGALCAVMVGLLVAYGLRFRHTTNRQLDRIARSLGEASMQVAATANQVSTASQLLASGASEQASSLEETSASLEEMASMTKRNAEGATRANEIARTARAAADTGSADMEAMNAAMHAIKTSSDGIAKIIKTIDEIAFQTNILALNAAVEAARAGEAGMGFAVVAEEVRALAQRSAGAAKETAEKIELAIAKTGQGVEISGRVARTLHEIVDKVRSVDELIAEVATASREQNQGVGQINDAIAQMDKVTQSNASGSEESAAAAEELNAQAHALQEAVNELSRLIGTRDQEFQSLEAPLAPPMSRALTTAPGLTAPPRAATAAIRAARPPAATRSVTMRASKPSPDGSDHVNGDTDRFFA